MSKVKSPLEKKRNSLLKDRRNVYNEGPAWSRKHVRRRKQKSHQALRRAEEEELRVVRGTCSTVDGDFAEERARDRLIEQKRASFKRMPDAPLAIVIDRKLKERGLRQEQEDRIVPFVGLHAERRAEERMMRQIRRK
jgi:hypothetical protein